MTDSRHSEAVYAAATEHGLAPTGEDREAVDALVAVARAEVVAEIVAALYETDAQLETMGQTDTVFVDFGFAAAEFIEAHFGQGD